MKISKTIINRIIDLACSKTEINFIIYIAQFQMKNGFIPNIYYKDVIDFLQINPTTFYRILFKLQCKDIIRYEVSEKYGFYNITILDNDFSDNDFNDGYVNINRAFLYSKEFLEMRATEKYVLLKLLSRNIDSTKSIALSDDSVAEYGNISKSNKKIINRIIETLQTFTSEGRTVIEVFIKQKNKNSKRVVNYFSLATYSKHTISETKCLQYHMFVNFCRKYRIPYTDKDIEDLIQMDNQYRFINQIYKSNVKDILLQYRTIESAVIRSIVDPIAQRLSSVVLEAGEWFALV